MTNGNRFLVLALLSFPFTIMGSVVKYSGTPVTVKQSGFNIAIYPEAAVTTTQGEVKLKLTGHGLRRKSIFGPLSVNVYYAVAYAEQPTALKPDPMEGLKKSRAKLIQLSLLRDLSSQTDLLPAFQDAMDKNKVNLNRPSLVKLFDQFDFDVHGGETILAIGSQTGNGMEEEIAIEAPKKKFSSKDDLLAMDFFSVWAGPYWDSSENIDTNMRELKKNLFGN